MFRNAGIFFLTLLLCLSTYAHVGSPGVVMEGNAGAYRLLVSIIPPDVTPGIAKVKVFLQNGTEAIVTARAVYFQTGDEGSPGAEQMKKVPGQTGQYVSDVWLMNGGSSSIQISVTGKLGKGVIVVPIVAVSSQIKKMPLITGIVLSFLGILLFVLIVSIIGYSVSDALTPAGDEVPVKRIRYRLAGITAGILLASFVALGGSLWWKHVNNNYKRYMFEPLQATSAIKNVNGIHELIFSLDTTSKRRSSFSYIIPDHGKLMHMFMVRIPSMDAFAHLHPVRTDSADFKTVLPGLPKGQYLIYADIVYTTGFAETIRDTLNIPVDLTNAAYTLDKDDGYAFALPVAAETGVRVSTKQTVISCGKPGIGSMLQDSSTMVLEEMTDEPFESGKLYQLKFSVLTPDKKMARLESYLGMTAHAAIIRNDGNVYIHLHPVGTFSMAAETNMLKRIAEPQGLYTYPEPQHFRDSIDRYVQFLRGLDESKRENILMRQMNMKENSSMDMNMDHNNIVEFPYSFPAPGNYRIWVQVKRNGHILTGVFDKMVQ